MLEKMRQTTSGNEMTGMLMKQNHQHIPLERLPMANPSTTNGNFQYVTVGGDQSINND